MANRDTANVVTNNGPVGFVFFAAWIGAVVYFIQTSPPGIWNYILAILKSFIWPAYVIFEVLKLLVI